MKITEADVVRVLHSRGMTVVMAVLMLAGAWWMYSHDAINRIVGDRGLLFDSANMWIADPRVSMIVNCGLTLGAALLMILLNKTYNLLRSVTQLDATLFMVMALALPDLLCQLYTGTMLVLVLLACLFLLYNTYGNRGATRNIFLIFTLLSAGAMTQYCYLVYVPVFLLGLGQMRIFTMRTTLAALLGLVTPWWIVFGLGIADAGDLHMPDSVSSVFINFGDADGLQLFVTVLLAAVMLIAGWFMNFVKMITYNAHLRAYTGTLSVMGLVTLVALCVDHASVCVYAPVLFMLAAFQLSHTFANRGREHTAAAIGVVILVYILLYIWRVA